jgi:hypothetical protein
MNMGLLNFLKKKNKKLSTDISAPKECLKEIPIEIADIVNKVNWADFETAYGNAEKTIPSSLKELFCNDTEIAMHATHELWCSLCHQHAYISTAALPAYDVLRIGLIDLSDKLKTEILDIFDGFVECTNKDYYEATRQFPRQWEIELRQKLVQDLHLFEYFAKHSDEVISHFATLIYEDLTKKTK